MKNLFLISILLLTSCSLLEQGKLANSYRQIASAQMKKIQTKESQEEIIVSGEITVYGQRDGHNSFDFPLLTLDTPFYEPLTFKIVISSDNVNCHYSSNIIKTNVNNEFLIQNNVYGDYLRCSYSGEGKKDLKISYHIPKLKSFAVHEASYMRGFYPDIVNNMELRLAEIYEKLLRVESGSANLFYRERELLLKYVPDVIPVTFDPKKRSIQFETEIGANDLFMLDNIEGSITHTKYGNMGYFGHENEDFKKFKMAGSSFLESQNVRPYALYCRHASVLHNFDFSNSLILSTPGKISCSLNTKMKKSFDFTSYRGEIKAEIKVMRISRALKQLPLLYLNKAQNAIAEKIDELNKANKDRISKSLQVAISHHQSNIDYMQEVDKSFAYDVMLDATLLQTNLYHKPDVKMIETKGSEQRVLTYKVFLKNTYFEKNYGELTSSDIYLGELTTNQVIHDIKKLGQYENFFTINPDDYEDQYFAQYSMHFNEKSTISYTNYIRLLKKLAQTNSTARKEQLNQKLALSRIGLTACGKIEPHINARGVVVEKVILNQIVARYDIKQGKFTEDQISLNDENFYTQKIEFKTPIILESQAPYHENKNGREQCYSVTPKDFAEGTLEESLKLMAN